MEARARLLGHPIHQMLIVFPPGLLGMSVVFDLIYFANDDQVFAAYEQELFSHVVTMAEKQGKGVELLVVPAVDAFDA